MSLVVWKGPTNALVTANNSPRFEWGDRVKLTDTYHGPQAVCAASMLARGTYGTGSRAGFVVNQSTCTNSRGGIGELTIEWEAGGTGASSPLPTGNTSISPQELYPNVERNPYFQGGSVPILAVDAALARMSMHGSTPYQQAQALSQLNTRAASSDPTTAASGALGVALASLLKKGVETYYVSAFRYTWEWYSYSIPTLNVGGIIQSPNGNAAVAISSASPISWLRLADGGAAVPSIPWEHQRISGGHGGFEVRGGRICSTGTHGGQAGCDVYFNHGACGGSFWGADGWFWAGDPGGSVFRGQHFQGADESCPADQRIFSEFG